MTTAHTNYLKVGLTGGIGSGKSTAARRFAALGAHVYHADEVARRALDPGAVCYRRVIEAFGPGVVKQDGTIDRKLLGEIIFANEEKRAALNRIVHPHVISELFALANKDLEKNERGIAVFEVPLLFESGMNESMDCNVLVFCNEESRLLRVMERDRLTREQALARMRAQMPEDEKRLLADFTLDNNGDEKNLVCQVDELYKTLQARVVVA